MTVQHTNGSTAWITSRSIALSLLHVPETLPVVVSASSSLNYGASTQFPKATARWKYS